MSQLIKALTTKPNIRVQCLAPFSIKRVSTPESCPLASTNVPLYTHMHTCTCAHTDTTLKRKINVSINMSLLRIYLVVQVFDKIQEKHLAKIPTTNLLAWLSSSSCFPEPRPMYTQLAPHEKFRGTLCKFHINILFKVSSVQPG